MPSRRGAPGPSLPLASDPPGPSTAIRALPYERVPWFYFLALLVGTALVVAAMWFSIERERRNTATHWRARISAIADNQARLVDGWINSRRADALVLAATPTVRSALVERAERPPALSAYLDRVAAAHGYASVSILDTGGRLVARSSAAADGPAGRRDATDTPSRQGVHIDLFDDPPGAPVFSISVPVAADDVPPGATEGRVLGSVVLRMDADSLFTLLTDDTAASVTGEILLFRVDGDRTAYLSPFREPPGAAAAVARSLDALRAHVASPAGGGDGFGRLIDYRGEPVLAATRSVAQGTWGLAVKVDRAEAMASFQRGARLAGVASAFFLLALAGLLIGLWRQQQRGRLLRARLEQERAIQESEQRLRELIEGLDAIVWEADAASLRFSFASQQAERVLGWPVERWLSEPEFFAERIHADDRARAMAASREAIERAVDHELEYRASHAEGREVWLRDIVHVQRGPDGRAVQLRGLTVDLTEQKRAEQALRQTEDQLRQAQKMDAVGKLAGGIAHDFNNLLMVIRGDSDLILRRLPEGHALRSRVEAIKDAADQAASLTRKLLTFSRKQVLAPAVLDINRIVAGMHHMLERLLGETIELVTVTAPELARVQADPGQIEQMLLNLVVNARDAMPDGGRLTIQTANADVDTAEGARRGAEPGRYVMVEVRDTGVGIDPEMKAHLFEPFFTTKEPGKGTGLGLSMVYGIVSQSGGHIAVESERGKGTSFGVYLPRAADGVGAGDPHGQAGGPEAEPRAGRPEPRKTILLVEDADRVREVVREILDMQGHEVIEARCGSEALELSARHPAPIDLMVTDVVMPEMSGRELAQRLASLRPEMRVLYMSGYTDDAIVRHGVLDAGVAFLPKPFTPDALAERVREILDAPRRGPQER